MRSIIYLISIPVLIFAGNTFAENEHEISRPIDTEIGRATFRFDNDMLARPSTDQNYTMGVAYTYSTHAQSSWIDSDPIINILDRFNSSIPFEWAANITRPSVENRTRKFILQNNAFTPKCLDTAVNCQAKGQPINQDRPYANLIWTGVGVSNEDNGRKIETEFDIGIFGTNIGNVVQTEIHQWCCKNNIPQEWDTQIGKGGALTFLYKQTYIYDLNSRNSVLPVSYRYGVWLGWNTWPTVGIDAKCCNRSVSSEGGAWKPWRSEWWKDRMRLEYDASYVLYNQSLQGAWGGANSIKYSHSQLSPIVTLMHFNLDLIKPENNKDGRGFSITYSANWKSRELKYSNVESRHRWGSLWFAWTSAWDHF